MTSTASDPSSTPEPVLVPPPDPFPSESRVHCPSCGATLFPPFTGRQFCPACFWNGEIYVFDPLPMAIDRTEHALSEDATCIHHPRKKATAVCAGTGDYICALCAVDVSGQTFSASYLSNIGNTDTGKLFDRYLQRPDNTIITLIGVCFVPYLNFIFLPTAFIWIPYAFYLYFKCLTLRQTNPLFARVMSRGKVVALPILLVVFSLLWMLGVVGVIVALLN